jgi:hypothetical protein
VYGLKVTGVPVMAATNTLRVIGLNPVVAVTIYPVTGDTVVVDMYGLKVAGAANMPVNKI